MQRQPGHLAAQEVDNTLWAMAKRSKGLLEVLDSPGRAAAAKVQRQPQLFDVQEVDDTLWAVAQACTALLEGLDSL